MPKIQDRHEAAEGFALSPRERQCLELLARGYRYDAIARELAISSVTVEKHLANARERLGATTRENAVARAIQAGLIRLEDC